MQLSSHGLKLCHKINRLLSPLRLLGWLLFICCLILSSLMLQWLQSMLHGTHHLGGRGFAPRVLLKNLVSYFFISTPRRFNVMRPPAVIFIKLTSSILKRLSCIRYIVIFSMFHQIINIAISLSTDITNHLSLLQLPMAISTLIPELAFIL